MNPLLQNNKPGYPTLVSDTGEGFNQILAAVTTTTVVVPTGTNQTTALPLLPGRNIITAAVVGSGVIITAPYQATSTIINLSGTTIYCYPPLASKFYLQSTNAPMLINSNYVTEFATTDGITFYVLTNSVLDFSGLPLSDAGLPAGAAWNNGGFVCIAVGGH